MHAYELHLEGGDEIFGLGYALDMAAVPLLALTNRWEVASALMLAERVGKGIR
ncbi:MAG: hypothetical protein JO116_19160, partial [Planctomycetaceae bacterium]|nr:hypothetical protein [Planctomycetaceae bacterium]